VAEIKKADVVLRPKRQVTLPREICDLLGIGPGDTLELTVENSILIGRSRKKIALDSLREIQEAAKRSGVSEEEFQKSGKEIRRELVRELYGIEE
jgi:AbrB family looped-hinge helix DNA binding protein